MAIIRDDEAKMAGPYAIGDKIQDALITDISATRVYLDVGGRKEYMELFDTSDPRPRPWRRPS